MSSTTKAKNSLLLLTQSLSELKPNVKLLLEESLKRTKKNLFIYINPLLGKVLTEEHAAGTKNSNPNQQIIIDDRFQLRTLINQFYQSSSRLNPSVNVVCLLHNIHQSVEINSRKAKLSYDLILADTNEITSPQGLSMNVDQFLRTNLPNSNSNSPVPFHIINCPIVEKQASRPSSSTQINPDVSAEYDLIFQNKSYENSILGGTFDRLHIGHKMLLSECVLLTRNRLLIGMADGPLLAKKKLAELIEDIDVRCKEVRDFLGIVAPTLNVLTTPIHDPFGPSITERDYQVIFDRSNIYGLE
jgi:phosphopantetheine adenylyltransferase/dephospho-CoA kinase